MRTIIYVILIFNVLISCKDKAEKISGNNLIIKEVETTNIESKITPKTNTHFFPDGKYCFLETINEHKKDTIYSVESTMIELIIKGNQVTGIYNWMPNGRSQAHGTLKGIIKDDTVKVIYLYTIEGSEQKEEKIFQLRENAIAIKKGELVEDANGILKLKDINNVSYSKVIPKVNCK